MWPINVWNVVEVKNDLDQTEEIEVEMEMVADQVDKVDKEDKNTTHVPDEEKVREAEKVVVVPITMVVLHRDAMVEEVMAKEMARMVEG